MKGIILSGGTGSRLFPSTFVVSKQLLPIYDKPMIYYPMSILMLAGIRDVLIISTPKDIHLYEELFGDGSLFGINIEYCVQENPNGLAEAFILGENFVGDDSVCLTLGDNLFYGHNLELVLRESVDHIENNGGGCVWGYYVQDPCRYGIVEFDENNKVIGLEEKPDNPKSNYAVPGLYFYDNNVVDIAKNISPSGRGELEITDVNKVYLNRNMLDVKVLKRGYAWFDAGTHRSLLEASQFVQTIQDRQGLKIACIEEIAFYKKYTSLDILEKSCKLQSNSEYGKYLFEIYRRHEVDGKR